MYSHQAMYEPRMYEPGNDPFINTAPVEGYDTTPVNTLNHGRPRVMNLRTRSQLRPQPPPPPIPPLPPQYAQKARRVEDPIIDHGPRDLGLRELSDGEGGGETPVKFEKLSKLDQVRYRDGFTSEKVSVRERMTHFTWCWFECTMSTGALAALLGQQPFDSEGIISLYTLGEIFFFLDLLLFVLFCVLISIRFWIRPAKLMGSLRHPQESFFFGTFWVSLAMILYGAQKYVVGHVVEGLEEPPPWLPTTSEILFWTYATIALQVAVYLYNGIFNAEQISVARHAMPTWILPAYPLIIMGPLSVAVLHNGHQVRDTPILLGGLIFGGLGWSLAFIMYTVYLTRLISGALPEESQRPGMFVAVGPAGYTASTLAGLGIEAPKHIPANYLGITSGIPTGDFWKAVSVPAAMFVWLLGFWFAAQALVSCVRGIRRMHFTLSWWAFVFPNVGLVMGLLQIGRAIQSRPIQAVVGAVTLFLVAVWIVVAVANVSAVVRGEVCWPGKDEDMDEMIAEEIQREEDKAGHED